MSQTDEEKKMHHQIENLAKNMNKANHQREKPNGRAHGGNGHPLQY